MKLIAGLDEVGMGSLAGPLLIVVAAFEQGTDKIIGVRDSKKTTRRQRKAALNSILENLQWLGFGWASHHYIDRIGISAAWQKAAHQALNHAPAFDILLVDGMREVAGYHGRQETVIKGDALHWQIGAASMLAKLLRDDEMLSYHNRWPYYGWNRNCGYGTESHHHGLDIMGISPIHRLTFIKKWFKRARIA